MDFDKVIFNHVSNLPVSFMMNFDNSGLIQLLGHIVITFKIFFFFQDILNSPNMYILKIFANILKICCELLNAIQNVLSATNSWDTDSNLS
jgi:hypothetical protein